MNWLLLWPIIGVALTVSTTMYFMTVDKGSWKAGFSSLLIALITGIVLGPLSIFVVWLVLKTRHGIL